MNSLKISINSELTEIRLVEDFIDNFCSVFSISSALYGRINLSVVEAVHNAILHGNKRNSNSSVAVIASRTSSFVKFTISDEGEGFDYSAIPDPTLSKDIIHQKGRGLYLMKTLSDELSFENNGSTVSLLFFL